IGVTFEKLPSIRELDSAYTRWLRPLYLTGSNGELPNHTIYQPFLDVIAIAGPFESASAGQSPSRRRLFSCYPRAAADETPCAKTILQTLAHRAYRRPVTDRDIDRLVAVYRGAAEESGFEGGIEAALHRVLVSPQFLYRIERDPANVAA